jgi:saccharopine dehydrogenase-like NADP-dependent oxidoreductase
MKVLVLGGCADMAAPLIRLLRDDREVERVVLADINEAKARKIAAGQDDRFTGVYCDADDETSVVSLMKGNEVVLCYVGPFYAFEKKLARCAIRARVPYISIADDYDAYLDVITLEDEARQANVKVLTGFGNSPGLTQILARKGYNDAPNVHRISVNWCAGSSETVGASNLMHLFHIFNGTTLQWFDGKEVPVKTGQGSKLVEFPGPVGKSYVYYTGHAESVSLPRNLPGLKEVTLHGGVKPNYIVGLVKLMSTLGLFRTHRRRVVLARFFHRIENWFSSPGLDKSVGRVEVYGAREGKGLHKYFTYVGHIADITSIPAYLAAKWLCAGKFDEKPGGVYAAERLLDAPDAFIAQLRDLGIEIYESPTLDMPGK